MRRTWGLLVVGALLAAVPATAGVRTASFGAPVKVNSAGFGYEPGIDVDSKGVLYVTAHKGSVTNEGTQLSSFLWSSRDHGRSWKHLVAPAHLSDAQFSFEGDIALDSRDRLYFVDTYGADTWLSRWDKGDAWERSGPAVTASVFDDRPWIGTQPEDVVWLLTTDIATHAAANGVPDPTQGSAAATSLVLYRSADGGITWSTGKAFPHAQQCGLATTPTVVAVACVVRTGDGGQQLVWFRSNDSGRTWSERPVYRYTGHADSFVSVAIAGSGRLVSAFADARPKGHRLLVAAESGRRLSVRDVTPLRGAFSHVWTTADRKGDVGVAFYATGPATPSATSDWFVYGGVGTSTTQHWSFSRADKRSVIRAPYAPADFLQCVLSPDGRFYVAYSRATTTDLLHAPPPNFDHDLYVVSRPVR
jgi:hypothetical protein